MADRARMVVDRIGSIAEAARVSGLSVNDVSRMCSGAHEPGVFRATTFARKMGVSLDFLLGMTDDMSPPAKSDLPLSIVEVPVVDARAAAGYGAIPDEVRRVDAFPFPRALIEKLGGAPNHVQCLRAMGDSMAPTIQAGALLIIDRSKCELPDLRARSRKAPRIPLPQDGVYVFYQRNAGLRVKRLRRLEREFLAVMSDNFEVHPPEILEPTEVGDVKIIGKVIWWDNRL